jgi:hypothetical protein
VCGARSPLRPPPRPALGLGPPCPELRLRDCKKKEGKSKLHWSAHSFPPDQLCVLTPDLKDTGTGRKGATATVTRRRRGTGAPRRPATFWQSHSGIFLQQQLALAETPEPMAPRNHPARTSPALAGSQTPRSHLIAASISCRPPQIAIPSSRMFTTVRGRGVRSDFQSLHVPRGGTQGGTLGANGVY